MRLIKAFVISIIGIVMLLAPGTFAIAATGPVYRLYNPKTGEHFYTVSHSEAITNGCSNPGYKLEASSYFLSDDISIPNATTVSRLYSNDTGDRLYSISANEISAAIVAGYHIETPSAFLAQTTWPSGGATVFRLYNVKTHRHLYTWNAGERDTAISNGYTNEGNAFYFSPSASVGVDRLYNPTTGDHLYTANTLETDAVNCLSPSYEKEGFAFSVNLDTAGGGNSVYRLRDQKGFHFYTKEPQEYYDNILKGSTLENATAFYVYSSSLGGYIPVYRLLNRTSGDHLFTVNSNEQTYALSHGYIAEGTAFYVLP